VGFIDVTGLDSAPSESGRRPILPLHLSALQQTMRTSVESTTASTLLHLRVFLSSPGDVQEERRAARDVVASLQKGALLRGRVTIDTVSYDDPDAPSPMTANETPQDAVNRYTGRPSECDLVVVILWSRLGTPIPPKMHRADGTRFDSGTVWEYEDALRANKDVWVYRRTEVPNVPLTDPAFEQKRADFAAVDRFFQRFANPDRSLEGGFSTYARAADFAPLFEKHLESLLRQRLEDAATSAPTSSASDLSISKLEGAHRMRALAGHPLRAHPETAALVYTGGVHASFTLAHNGNGAQSINLFGLSLELLRFTPGRHAALDYAVEGEAIQGAGLARPHVFSISLRGDKVGPATWVTDARAGRIAVAKSANFFDTDEPQLLTFPAGRSDIEELQGTVLATQTGLYEFRFVFDYSVGGDDRQQATSPLLVYVDE